jgi:hypothetical protein
VSPRKEERYNSRKEWKEPFPASKMQKLEEIIMMKQATEGELSEILQRTEKTKMQFEEYLRESKKLLDGELEKVSSSIRIYTLLFVLFFRLI